MVMIAYSVEVQVRCLMAMWRYMNPMVETNNDGWEKTAIIKKNV